MAVYCVDKPLGLTSHDVVARARRTLGTRKVGHAGTLDPLATGVLLVLVDEGTKLSPYLTGHDKSYLAWVTFGAGTPTLDAEGPLTARGSVSHVNEDAVSAAIAPFLSLTEQRPPAFSAIKQAGERSYAAARRGDLVEPPLRAVAYRSVTLLAFAPSRSDLPTRFAPQDDAGVRLWRPQTQGREFDLPPALESDQPLPTALLSLTVAAGTYVRAFARDLGTALGTPAHLSGLVRVASGGVDLSWRLPIERDLTLLAGASYMDNDRNAWSREFRFFAGDGPGNGAELPFYFPYQRPDYLFSDYNLSQ
ncbi:MAG TPA: tRNA pseudouridine(55) synthase TruB, partial [Trueperaceae bacterium]|nr:tRNA pseudouridine(55) synthase TruB [Trueperaceae bacterium]